MYSSDLGEKLLSLLPNLQTIIYSLDLAPMLALAKKNAI